MALDGILGLPTEILVEIFELLPTDSPSLYHLGLTSRRLHFIALPIYFARNGVDLQARSAAFILPAARPDVLSALQICLFLPSLKYLKCAIPHYISEPSITPFLENIKRLEYLVSRLSSVKRVSLRLASRLAGERWSICLGTDQELCAWSVHVGALLNSIVQRECERLTIIDGSFVELPVRRGLLRRMGGRIVRRNADQNPLSMPPFPGSSKLTSLVIDSRTLLSPPGIDWLLAALRQAPITKLTLAMYRADAGTWETVLPRIASAAPALTRLILTRVDLPVEPSALAVLECLPCLTNLYISHMYALNNPIRRAPVPGLRALCTLSAPPALVEHLFSTADALPALRTLCVLWETPSPNFPTLLHHLGTLNRQLATRAGEQTDKPPVVLKVSIRARSVFTAAEVIPVRALVEDDSADHGIAAACARVKQLHLDLAIAAADTQGVAALVALFPGVTCVSLATETSLPSAAVTGLLQAIQTTEVLKMVELNGKKCEQWKEA
ncbi:hypothetical protein B0H19DRAFT_1237227 [Mycena capillaripes]|nr:hypothetical protein B0H19DRAFT_1237227 [Mycena capillaripes]